MNGRMTGFQSRENAGSAIRFVDKVRRVRPEPLTADDIKVLQVNMGFECNMGCKHCHLSAGPGRSEIMDLNRVQTVLQVLRQNPIQTLDITGGAPELNPHFRFLVLEARKAGKRIIARTNLTVFFEPGMQDLPDFYRAQAADLIASLPCYLEENVNAVRGKGAFDKSIEALRRLNLLGYGHEPSGLSLSLVYNPGGRFSRRSRPRLKPTAGRSSRPNTESRSPVSTRDEPARSQNQPHNAHKAHK